jgi:nicotinate-nucleotide adenylyltransferase
MRVAIFGGSFNPPHVAHQMAALYVLETAPVDELWWIPCFKHPFDKPLAPFDDRFEMCRRAAAPLGARVRVDDVERAIGAESRTLRTVQHLQARHPQHQFLLIIGSDLVGQVDSWYGGAELKATVPFIVVGRAGAGPGGPVQLPAISSTAIRDALGAGKTIEGLVPRAVLDYIYQRGLFQAREPE